MGLGQFQWYSLDSGWNELPLDIKSGHNINAFDIKFKMKTFLFKRAHNLIFHICT